MKITDNFHVEELVHPLYIEQYGAAKMARVIKRYAPYMLLGLEQLKGFIGGESVIINDYKWGGDFINSGVRHFSDPLRGSSLLSAHYFMQATDCKFKNRNIKDLQQSIIENPYLHRYITRMEHHSATPTWLHVQWGFRQPNTPIKIFKP